MLKNALWIAGAAAAVLAAVWVSNRLELNAPPPTAASATATAARASRAVAEQQLLEDSMTRGMTSSQPMAGGIHD